MPNNKILIIDDDQLIIRSIQRSLTLEENNYEILTASNGKAGLEIYRKEQPILVLLDLNMPVLGGIEFLKEVKLTPTDPSAIIVLSGHSDDECVKRCFDLGISSFLRKPINMYEFFGLVKHVIAFKNIQKALKEKCEDNKTAQRHFDDQKTQLLSAMIDRVKRPLIPIVNCTQALLEGKVISEKERMQKLQEIRDASSALVDIFENPAGS